RLEPRADGDHAAVPADADRDRRREEHHDRVPVATGSAGRTWRQVRRRGEAVNSRVRRSRDRRILPASLLCDGSDLTGHALPARIAFDEHISEAVLALGGSAEECALA